MDPPASNTARARLHQSKTRGVRPRRPASPAHASAISARALWRRRHGAVQLPLCGGLCGTCGREAGGRLAARRGASRCERRARARRALGREACAGGSMLRLGEVRVTRVSCAGGRSRSEATARTNLQGVEAEGAVGLADGGVNRAVSPDQPLALKRLRHDHNLEVRLVLLAACGSVGRRGRRWVRARQRGGVCGGARTARAAEAVRAGESVRARHATCFRPRRAAAQTRSRASPQSRPGAGR